MPHKEAGIYDQVRRECLAMARHALATGKKLPPQIVCLASQSEAGQGDAAPVTELDLERLAAAHAQLASIVAPAAPHSILLLEEERQKQPLLAFLGPVPLIRRMSVAAIVALVAFLGTSLSEQVNAENALKSLFDLNGVELFLNQLFRLSAAALGACFAALFQASRYVADGTYDPKFEATYWTRFVLGLIAGTMLAELVDFKATGVVDASAAGSGQFADIAKPLLALVGGFSAAVVYRILSRIVDAIESLVRGDTRDIVAAREATVVAQQNEATARQNIRVASQLTALKGEIGSKDAGLLQGKIDKLIQGLVPDSADALEEPRSGPLPGRSR